MSDKEKRMRRLGYRPGKESEALAEKFVDDDAMFLEDPAFGVWLVSEVDHLLQMLDSESSSSASIVDWLGKPGKEYGMDDAMRLLDLWKAMVAHDEQEVSDDLIDVWLAQEDAHLTPEEHSVVDSTPSPIRMDSLDDVVDAYIIGMGLVPGLKLEKIDEDVLVYKSKR